MPHKDPAAHLAYCQEYRRKNAGLLAAKQRVRRQVHPWTLRTPEQVERDREAQCARSRRYKERHPDRVAASRETQRLRMRGVKRDRSNVPKDYHRNWWLKKRYGLTQGQYDAMVAAQHGGCAVCGGPPTTRGKFYVDHDHATGAIRSLLCHGCNSALGHVGEDANVLELMIGYLAKHRLRVVA